MTNFTTRQEDVDCTGQICSFCSSPQNCHNYFPAFSKVPANGKGDLLVSVYQEVTIPFANSVINFANSVFLAVHSFLRKHRWSIMQEELKKDTVVTDYEHHCSTFFSMM